MKMEMEMALEGDMRCFEEDRKLAVKAFVPPFLTSS